MLFNYRYVYHDIQKVQAWLDHLVKVVWCRDTGRYSTDLLQQDLRGVVEDIANDERTGDWLDGPIRRIDALFQTKLTSFTRASFAVSYDNNNDIEALCANDPSKAPITYTDIKAIDAALEAELRSFCTALFTNVIDLAPVTRRTGTIDTHYDEFMAVNRAGKCPYCGLSDIKGLYHSRREAYDHFLPKDIYPFNTVNFRNLAPMCHDCNSSYKLRKDPLRHIDPIHKPKLGARRRAFYSYANVQPGLSIDLKLSSTDIDNLCPTDITVSATASGRTEEVEAWKDVFGIEERYRAKCCGENDGKYWLVQARDECKNAKKAPIDILRTVEENAAKWPWAEVNFLKKPFLIACNEAGLLR